MVYKPRTRKRVYANAIRRSPDGNAFEKCECCGVSVAIALADMHECESKKNVKKLKGHCQSGNTKWRSFQDQPREEFAKTCDEDENEIHRDRKRFKTWKNMLEEERHSYVLQAENVNSAYINALLKEENDIDLSWVDDEADSAEVGSTTRTMKDSSSMLILKTLIVMVYSGPKQVRVWPANCGQECGQG